MRKADTEDRQNDDGSSAESWQAESDGSDAGNRTEINSMRETQPEMIYVDVCGAVAAQPEAGCFRLLRRPEDIFLRLYCVNRQEF